MPRFLATLTIFLVLLASGAVEGTPCDIRPLNLHESNATIPAFAIYLGHGLLQTAVFKDSYSAFSY